MKTLTFNRLAPCLVVALVALSATSARSQEAVLPEPMPAAGTYVGDLSSCSSCGAVVDEDNGMLHGACPNCGGVLGHLGLGNCGACMGTIHERGYGRPDLFYNYYTQGFANRANAQMYLSPLPVPPNVGHTFYTYQPFLPHHHMYPHIDKYHRHFDCGRGMNRTKATYWQSACSKAKNFYWVNLRLPR